MHGSHSFREMQRRHRITCFNRFIFGTISVYLEHFQLFGTDVAAQKETATVRLIERLVIHFGR
jgi:hypothetical protein